jgi:hypothetical protein
MSYVTPDDNVHRWTNFLKNYQMPRVEAVTVKGTFGDLSIPLVTALCVVALVPVGWQLQSRRRADKPVALFAVGALVLVGGAIATAPYARVSMSKPAALVSSLSDQQATVLLQTLLKNVYRAFDFRNEEDVYDKLALSVSGDLLAEVYLQNRKSFAIQRAGGAQAKIKAVEIQEARAKRLDDKPLAYAVKGRWTASGAVGHWGHVHTRQNLYEAIVTIEAVQDSWKITDLELLEEKRIDPYAQRAAAASAAGS